MAVRAKTAFGIGALLITMAFSAIYFAALNKLEKHPLEHSQKLMVKRSVKNGEKFTFDNIWDSKFSYKTTSRRWISGDQYISMDPEGNVYQENASSSNIKQIMPGDFYTSNNASSYKVSSTQEYILLLTNYKAGWRHSYNGTYLIFNVTSQQLLAKDVLPDDIQYIVWSPRGNELAYVRGFDIFYRKDPTGASIQVTDTGRANQVYNGIPDWVYEEEMISSNNVMYFSPDGSQLAYAQFNDTLCDHIQFITYKERQYPQLIDVSYPKAGTVQPTNKVYVYSIADQKNEELIPPAKMSEGDYLFNRVTWASNTRAAVMWCNREQTWSVTSMCDYSSSTWSCPSSPEYEHKVLTGWLHQRRPYWIPVFGQDKDEVFKVLPNNGWQHIARVNKTTAEFQTSGEYTVTSESASYPSVEFYDSSSDQVYFVATIEGPGKRQIYRVSGHTPGTPQCITCPIASEYPGRCDYVTASFSTDASYVVVGCRGESAPLDILCRVDHAATDVENVLLDKKVLEDNTDLVAAINSTEMSQVIHRKFTSSTGYEFYYEQWNPPNFNENDRYPLLIDVYAGPGYQNVDYRWTRSWAPRYVPASLNVIVVRVDGRGSNFYGDEFMHEVYRNLGQKEIDDQVEAARHFADLPYIDESRIAIWGWSYGGFATSHAISIGSDILKCGLAVAPLTDWRYYDTIYAERYMGLPSDNLDGYQRASVINKAGQFPQSSYFLIHGMADDNVHFQNAAQLEKALVKEDITFNDFFYADQDHSINNGNAYKHVYQILTKQLCQCFGIAVPEDVWQ